MNVYDKIVIISKKKRKFVNQRNHYINLHLKYGLGMELMYKTAAYSLVNGGIIHQKQ